MRRAGPAVDVSLGGAGMGACEGGALGACKEAEREGAGVRGGGGELEVGPSVGGGMSRRVGLGVSLGGVGVSLGGVGVVGVLGGRQGGALASPGPAWFC